MIEIVDFGEEQLKNPQLSPNTLRPYPKPNPRGEPMQSWYLLTWSRHWDDANDKPCDLASCKDPKTHFTQSMIKGPTGREMSLLRILYPRSVDRYDYHCPEFEYARETSSWTAERIKELVGDEFTEVRFDLVVVAS